ASMDAAILDEPPAGVESTSHRSREVDATTVRLQCGFVTARRTCFVLCARNAQTLEKVEVWPVAGHSQHPVVLDRALTLGRVEHEISNFDPRDSRAKMSLNGSLPYSILEIRFEPVFDGR